MYSHMGNGNVFPLYTLQLLIVRYCGTRKLLRSQYRLSCTQIESLALPNVSGNLHVSVSHAINFEEVALQVALSTHCQHTSSLISDQEHTFPLGPSTSILYSTLYDLSIYSIRFSYDLTFDSTCIWTLTEGLGRTITMVIIRPSPSLNTSILLFSTMQLIPVFPSILFS